MNEPAKPNYQLLDLLDDYDFIPSQELDEELSEKEDVQRQLALSRRQDVWKSYCEGLNRHLVVGGINAAKDVVASVLTSLLVTAANRPLNSPSCRHSTSQRLPLLWLLWLGRQLQLAPLSS